MEKDPGKKTGKGGAREGSERLCPACTPRP